MAPLVASISETRHIAPRARVMPVDGARAPTRCEVCDCDVPARLMPQHERGARHRAKLRTRDSLTWRCVACDASMPARARFEHERTKRHRSNARDALLGAYRCDVCEADVPGVRTRVTRARRETSSEDVSTKRGGGRGGDAEGDAGAASDLVGVGFEKRVGGAEIADRCGGEGDGFVRRVGARPRRFGRSRVGGADAENVRGRGEGGRNAGGGERRVFER